MWSLRVARVMVSWAVALGSGPVCAQSVQKSVNGGSTWTTLPAPAATATSMRTTVTPGKATIFRVQETGCNTIPSAWTASAPVTATITQETSASIGYSTGWTHQACTACSGGGLEQTSAKDATATISLTGVQAAALVLADRPSDGKATVATDAGAATTINTHAPTAKNLRYCYAANWATDGNHTMVLTNLATATHPDLQLDAIVTLR